MKILTQCQEFFCGGMLRQGQDAPEFNLMAPVKGKRMPLYMLMTMIMMTIKSELLNFTLMGNTHNHCMSIILFSSTVEYFTIILLTIMQP